MNRSKREIFGATGNTLRQVVVMAAVLAAASLQAQVKAPRYSGTPVDAPTVQVVLPPLPPALTPHGQVVEDVVVQVNDQIISRSDVERSAAQLQQDAEQNHTTPERFAEAQKNLLRDLIDQQLLLSRAKELSLNADTEVIRQLDDIRKKNNLDSMDALEKAARGQGVNFEDFKAQIRNQILTQQVVRDEVGRHLQMSQAEETKYYDEHKSEFDQPEQVRLSEILIPLPETATQAEITQAEVKANAIKSQIMGGADFADTAKKISGGPSAAQGGDLGLWKRGGLAKVLEDATFSLKSGESTQPIRTRQGFVILKVTQHIVAGPAPMKEVEGQIQEQMYIQQMQPALRAYLTKLRGDAYIDLQPGFVDSGATGNESKLINTAYAPPPIKKKPETAKKRFERAQAATAAKKVVASPDTTGSRTLTGTDAPTDANTGLAVLTPTKAAPAKASNGKIAKVKKEKIRFGHAPTSALPGSDDANQTAVATSNNANSTPAATAPANEVAANIDDNPLTPNAPEVRKTRFSAKAKEEKEKKATNLSAKSKEKILAKPVAATDAEKAQEKIEAAPLSVGANDESKKQPKPKKVKGATKERLAEKPVAPAATAPKVEQTANPNLAPTDATPPSTKIKPSADQTTLPGTTPLPPNTPPVTPTVPPPPPPAN